MRLSSVPSLGGGRPGWSGGLSLGPLPPRTACRRHRRIATTARYLTTGAGQTPGPFLASRTLLAVSGSSGGWPARVSSSHTWEARMWSAIAGAQGTGACSRLNPPVPGPRGGRGHTCRAQHEEVLDSSIYCTARVPGGVASGQTHQNAHNLVPLLPSSNKKNWKTANVGVPRRGLLQLISRRRP